MNPIANLIVISAIILDIFLFVFILMNSRKTKATYYFMASLIAIAIWSGIELIILLGIYSSNPLLLQKILKSMAFIYSVFFLTFIVYFTQSKIRWPAWIVVILNMITAIVTLSTNLIIGGVSETLQSIQGPIYMIAPILMPTSMFIALGYIIMNYRKTDDQRVKTILKYMIFAFLLPAIVGIPMGITTMLGMQTFMQTLPMASIFATIIFSFLTYTLLKYDF